MTTLSNAEWRIVENAYVSGAETIGALAKRFKVASSTIYRRRDRHRWAQPRTAAEPEGFDKAALVKRFYRLINLKLEQMEEDMARSSERTPADSERETRALGTLIRNFEKVFGLEQEGGKDDGKQGRVDGPEPRAEAEAIRRELAQRLVRLREVDRSAGN